MKVWFCSRYGEEYYEVEKIFDSREKAEAYLKTMPEYTFSHPIIEEREVE